VPIYIVVRFSLRNSWWTGIHRLVVPVFSVRTFLILSNSLVLFVPYQSQRRNLSHCESSEPPSYSMKLVEFPSYIQSNGLNLITDLIALFPLKFKFLGFLQFHAIQGTCAPEGHTMSDSGWMFLTVASPLTEPTTWVRASLLAFKSCSVFWPWQNQISWRILVHTGNLCWWREHYNRDSGCMLFGVVNPLAVFPTELVSFCWNPDLEGTPSNHWLGTFTSWSRTRDLVLSYHYLVVL